MKGPANQNDNLKDAENRLHRMGNRIKLPETLHSKSLLPQLDGVKQHPKRGFAWPGHWFSFQSGLSYVVALTLVVGVFYIMHRNNPEMIIDGRFTVEPAPASMAPHTAGIQESDELPGAPLPFGMADTTPDAPSLPLEDPVAGGANPPQPEAPAPFAYSADSLGIGGNDPGNLLGKVNDYVLSWRVNDPADLDKEGNITLLIISESNEAEHVEVDIPLMQQVNQFFIEENRLVLVGTGGQDTIVLSYSGFQALELEPECSLVQPGAHVGTRFYQGYVYTASVDHSDPPQEVYLDFAMEELPGSLEQGTCYLSALDPSSGESSMAAFSKCGDDVTLFDHHLYITYNGAAPEDPDEKDLFVAQIATEGMEIKFVQVS